MSELLTEIELAEIASDNDTRRPYTWSPDFMGGEHYTLAECAVEAVPRLLTHVAALTDECKGLRREAGTLKHEAAMRTETALESQLDELHEEFETLKPFAAIGKAYVRMKELDALCDKHPGNDDETGAAAESELMELVGDMRRMLAAVEAARSPCL
jgi:hypothetical protein